ncbi:YopX family protein [bacterium]|nr:YopX family protein [bacterium]
MREIKFRAWLPEENEWEGAALIEMEYASAEENNPSIRPFHLEGKKFILEQHTGLKDKNDKEIYEGDIISKSGAYVLWSKRLACWAFNFKGVKSPETPFFYETKENLEVVGNIHENPELLK